MKGHVPILPRCIINYILFCLLIKLICEVVITICKSWQLYFKEKTKEGTHLFIAESVFIKMFTA